MVPIDYLLTPSSPVKLFYKARSIDVAEPNTFGCVLCAEAWNEMDEDRAILVAEDDALIREIMCEVLSDHGFRPAPVATTEEALSFLDRGQPLRAAFLDIDLGDRGGGYQVARKLCQTHPGVQIVYTSGGARADYERERVAGARFVQKPYLPDEVCTILAKCG